jgi:release factor glutamine methyltransferase
MRLHEAMRFLRMALESSGCGEAVAQSRQLLFGVLHLDGMKYLARRDEYLTKDEQAALDRALARRMKGEPLQYVLGEWPFYGRMFLCDKRALIPREDTETVIHSVLAELSADRPLRGIDVGTGTGAIGLTLAAERPCWDVTCLDISEDALALAKENAERLGLSNVHFVRGDMREVFPEASYDFIVSNPPYVRKDEIGDLAPELAYEPRLALDGGTDGLDYYRALSLRFADSLMPGGLMTVEAGFGQADSVSEMLAPLADCIRTEKDMAGIERAVTARRKG